MVKVGVNGFGCTGYLVIKAAFHSGRMDIVANNDHFVDLSCMVYKFQYNSIHDKLNSAVKAENGKLIIKENSMSIFQG